MAKHNQTTCMLTRQNAMGLGPSQICIVHAATKETKQLSIQDWTQCTNRVFTLSTVNIISTPDGSTIQMGI